MDYAICSYAHLKCPTCDTQYRIEIKDRKKAIDIIKVTCKCGTELNSKKHSCNEYGNIEGEK